MVPAEPVLRMAVHRSGGSAVLELAGEADVASEGRLRLRLRDLVQSHPPVLDVVVDARELTFLDLTALRVLLEAADELRARGGGLVLRSPGRRVRRLLSLLSVDGRLPVVD